MRKDVKVGLASGAVLVAVAAVYVSSLTSTPTVERRTGVAARLNASGSESSGTLGANSSVAKRGGISIAGETVTPSTPSNDLASSAPVEPRATGVRSPDVTVGTVATATGVEPDWNKLLNQGPQGSLPSLMNHTGGTATPNLGTTPSRADAEPAGPRAAVTGSNGPTDVFAEATPNSPSQTRTNAPATPTYGAPPESSSVNATAYAGPNAGTSRMTSSSSTAAIENGTGATSSGTGMTTHVVKTGESFYTIAQAAYGNSHFYPHLLRANPDVNPNRLKPGMTIKVPAASSVKPSESPTLASGGATNAPGSLISLSASSTPGPRKPRPTAATTPLAAGEYRVAQDENLYRIAVKLYGSPRKMQEIYDLNKSTIGSDPAKVKVGAILKLPAGANR